MAIIEGDTTARKKFPPMVNINNVGDFVKGTVTEVKSLPKDKYGHIKPAITLKLVDLKGETKESRGRGEPSVAVDVEEGAEVVFIGSGTDLRAKLPKLRVGNLVTITYTGDLDTGKGNPFKQYQVEVD
jgi:hypothetical protein